MKMHYSHGLSSRRIAQIVGIFVVVPLAVLAVVGVIMAKAQHLFERKYHVKTSLSKSYGLEPGSPVLFSGIPIGRVELVDLNDRGTVDVLLQLRSRYQELVREDSEVRIAKSGIVVGQTQVDITMGSATKPALADGATIRAVEPKDIGELVDEIKPVLDSVKQTLLRVEDITKDMQAAIQTGGRVVGQVEEATRELPTLIASVRSTVSSVEHTATSLPNLTSSITQSLSLVDGIARDVKTTTSRLPAVIDTAEQTVRSVRELTESVKGVTNELGPILETTQATMDDISMIVRGAKNTFPISTFVKNAGSASTDRSALGLTSLRGDRVSR